MLHNKDFSVFDLSLLLGELLDRQNIQDTIARSSLGQGLHHGKDSEISHQWDETFSKDGLLDYSVVGGPVGSYRDLAKWMRQWRYTRQHERLFQLAAHGQLADRYPRR